MQMNWIPEPIARILPQRLRAAAEPISGELAEELRLRAGKSATVVIAGRERALCAPDAPPVRAEELAQIVSAACAQSVYSAQRAISQGYFTLPGGHRLGICGSAVCEGGEVRMLRDYSSLCIRIAREKTGCADAVTAALSRSVGSVLIIGAPGSGKTTLLRDLVRQLSDTLGCRVSLADERGEVAAVSAGVPQLDVGRYTDVLSGADKSEAMMMMLRAMNPQFLAADEISDERGVRAAIYAAHCGVHLAATAHAASREEAQRRPLYRALLASGVFDYLVTLRRGAAPLIERLDAP